MTWLRDFTGNLYGHLAGETSGMLQDIPGLTTYPEWPSAKANLRIGLQSHPYLLSHRQLPFLFTKGPKYLSFLNKSLSQIITPASDETEEYKLCTHLAPLGLAHLAPLGLVHLALLGPACHTH